MKQPSFRGGCFIWRMCRKKPLLFQQPATGLVLNCKERNGFRISRSDGISAASMSMPASDRLSFLVTDWGARYLPRFHHKSGELVLDNDPSGRNVYFTSVYNVASNRWLEVAKPLTAAHSWFSYQTRDGVTGYCGLRVTNDSLFLSIYRLNATTRKFDSLFSQPLPEFSGKRHLTDCRILSYNDEGDQLVLAVAWCEGRKPLEGSVYKMEQGASHFTSLYTAVSLPASESRFGLWGRLDVPGAGTFACTPDGQLYDLVQDDVNYYLVTVDAGGIHERARFQQQESGRMVRWPLFYLNSTFYLLAQNIDNSGSSKNHRMEILRVR